MIVRTIKSKNYFSLNRTACEDERLSLKAVGIHTYLMSKPDHWEANEKDIINRHKDGRASVRAGMQELVNFGYMNRVQIRRKKKIVKWRIDTYESPELNPHFDPKKGPLAVTENLESENQTLGVCENQTLDGLESDFRTHLESDFLQVENLQVENRIHSNKRSVVSNELKKDTTTTNPDDPRIVFDDADNFNGPTIEEQTQSNQPTIAHVFDLYQKCIGTLNVITSDQIKDAYDDYGGLELEYAIKQAAKANANNLNYILKVCANRKAGYDPRNGGHKGTNYGSNGNNGGTTAPGWTGDLVNGSHNHLIDIPDDTWDTVDW